MNTPTQALATMNDGTAIILQIEDWQPVEPAAYCWEAGAWCYGTTGDVYFVSQDGRVDRWADGWSPDGKLGLHEVQMGAGLVPAWDAAARRLEDQMAGVS